jgi:xylulokinase
MTYLLGIDAGTTSIKAGLFALDGRCLAIEREEYILSTPAPERVELDPEIYWQACVKAVHGVLSQARVDVAQIKALAVSSQGETIIPLDQRGKPLGPAIIWLDNRATEEAAYLDRRYKEVIYQFTGESEVIATWSACKIMWLRKHQPKLFRSTSKFLMVQDWLVYRLTGNYVTDAAVASSTLLCDIVQTRWWDSMLEEVGIREDQLPILSISGEVAGTIRRIAAEEIGLGQHTLVVLGGMDQCAGAIGAGNILPGMVSETTGAALAVQITSPQHNLDPAYKIPVYRHSVPGMYLACPFCPTAGMTFKWFRDVFGEKELDRMRSGDQDAYDLLTSLAIEVAPGADGLLMLPHLQGSVNPVYNSDARGVFSGFSLSHHKGHFVRAILEAVAFMLRRNLDQINLSGIPTKEVRSSGGAARSDLWNQIKADICEVPVLTLVNEEAALLGDSILAGVACGEIRSLKEGCDQMVALKNRFIPGINREKYRMIYQKYCDLDQTMNSFFQRNADK